MRNLFMILMCFVIFSVGFCSGVNFFAKNFPKDIKVILYSDGGYVLEKEKNLVSLSRVNLKFLDWITRIK